jgi:hypothetical protein
MIQYTWQIVQTNYTLDDNLAPDRINTLHWRCDAKEGNSSAAAYGTVSVDMDAKTATESDALTVVQDNNPDVEANLAAQLDQVALPNEGAGLPWEAQFPAWQAGKTYAPGDKVNYSGVGYECIQGHTSERGWTPNAVPALWQVIQDTSGPDIPWIAGEAVQVDDRRTYQGTPYICIQAHTTQAGWEPPNVPNLWQISEVSI